jgi:hypothetical protein
MRLMDRLGALSGAAGVLLVIVGNDVLSTPPGPQTSHPSGQKDIADMQWVADHAWAQVGVSLNLLGFALGIVFVAYLVTRVRGAGWLAVAALMGGVLEIAIKLGSAAPVFAAYAMRDQISPQIARALLDMDTAAFVTTWLPFGIFVAFASAAGLQTGVLGRVLGWGGVVVGTVTVLVTAVTGVHVLSAIFVPFLLCLVWELLVSLRLGLARTRTVETEIQVPTAQVAPSPL